MRWLITFGTLSLLTVAVTAGMIQPAQGQGAQSGALPFGYPRVALYGSVNGIGEPLVNVGTGQIDQAALTAMARFPLAILPPTPLTDNRPDVFTALRTANPNQHVYAYLLGHTTFCTPTYGVNVYYRKYWETVEAYDGDPDPFCNPADTTNAGGTGPGFLWWQNGAKGNTNVNLAHRVSDGQGGWTYDLAGDLGVLFAQTVNTGNYDGAFLDIYCADILWQETGSLKYDYQRAGYGSNNADPTNRTNFQTGWQDGFTVLMTAFRNNLADASKVVSGNCGQSPAQIRTTANGWMQENFPLQNGGTWLTNMYGNGNVFGGYFADDYLYRAPQLNYIFTGLSYQSGNPNEWQNATQQQRLRFGLASATLGEGFAAYGDYAAHAYTAPYHTWWADEYGVNRQTGQSSTSLNDVGWLGEPLTERYQMVNDSGVTNLVTNPEFETNMTGWNFTSSAPASATVTRVLEGGDYAAQITINQVGSVAYAINLASTSTFSIINNQPITITFWAKASTVRPLNLIISKTGVEYGRQAFTLTTTWKKYQFSLTANATIADAQFRIDMGQTLGDVIIDSLTVQSVAGNAAYRRDFQNGIVLINPLATPVTVTLERPFRRILGTVNPTTNNGQPTSQVTLAGSDALFLLDFDGTPPAAVTDLRTQ